MSTKIGWNIFGKNSGSVFADSISSKKKSDKTEDKTKKKKSEEEEEITRILLEASKHSLEHYRTIQAVELMKKVRFSLIDQLIN